MAEKKASLILSIKRVGEEALSKTADALEALRGLAISVFTAVAGAVTFAIHQYREQELAVNKLNQSLVQQGIFTKELSRDYQELADELQRKTQFNDEEIIQAQATMQAYLGQTKISKELLQATLDLAAKTGDLSSAAQLVGRTIGTSTNALARQGLALSDTAPKAERLARTIAFLNGHFGGQAEAAAAGLGSISQLKKRFTEFAEDIGSRIAPAIIVITKHLTSLFDGISKNSALIDLIVDGFNLFAKAGIQAFSEINIFGKGVGALIATIGAALVATAKGNFQEAITIIKEGNKQASAEAEAIRARTAAVIKQFDDAEVQAHQDKNDKKLEADAQRRASELEAEEEHRLLVQERDIAVAEAKKIQEDTLRMGLKDIALQHELDQANKSLAIAKTAEAQRDALNKKREIMHKAMVEGERQRELALNMAKIQMAQMYGDAVKQLMDNLVTLTKGRNKTILALQKAAAIGQVIINTRAAITRGYQDLGPIGGSIFHGIMEANQAASIAIILGTELAEGGIVRATPGGVPAIIGEGGRDEAVIPLDSDEARDRLGGGGITVVVYGGLLGDRTSARELAVALDKELFELRRANQSLAFDEAVI